MNNKYVLPNLVRYFRDMKNEATSHDKIVLLLSIAILVGCGYGALRNLFITVHWSKALLVTVAIVFSVMVWLVSFALGVIFRAPSWQHVFPPYRLVGMATVPALFISIVVGWITGTALFKISFSQSIGASFLGYMSILIVMHLLYLLRAPSAKQAVKIFHDPNMLTVNSHRSVWIYPAIGVLVLFWVARRYIPVELEAIGHIAVIASIAASVMYSGFGAGYIP